MAIGDDRPGKRHRNADRTRLAILAAARELVAAAHTVSPSVGAVAARAGVSRLTVYDRFGSKAGLMDALAAEARSGVKEPGPAAGVGDPREELRRRLAIACAIWGSDPALFRQLPAFASAATSEATDRPLAERLAAADQLRAGCSIKEAEDVIGVLASFNAFNRLHKDGRRSTAAVAEILVRLAACILA